MAKEYHRLRLTVDLIVEGPVLSRSEQEQVANEFDGWAQGVLLDGNKKVKAVYKDRSSRTHYAHYHDSNGGQYCAVRNGCLEQAQDGLDQNIEES